MIGTATIDTVTVFRNDEAVWSRDYLTDTSDSPPSGPVQLELSFHSDATPGHWGDMKQGRLSMPTPIPGYADGIALRRIARGGQKHAEFTFTDDSDPRHGDYYYVRVRQANDAAAWSSPIWVGGYAHR